MIIKTNDIFNDRLILQNKTQVNGYRVR